MLSLYIEELYKGQNNWIYNICPQRVLCSEVPLYNICSVILLEYHKKNIYFFKSSTSLLLFSVK